MCCDRQSASMVHCVFGLLDSQVHSELSLACSQALALKVFTSLNPFLRGLLLKQSFSFSHLSVSPKLRVPKFAPAPAPSSVSLGYMHQTTNINHVQSTMFISFPRSQLDSFLGLEDADLTLVPTLPHRLHSPSASRTWSFHRSSHCSVTPLAFSLVFPQSNSQQGHQFRQAN